MKLDSDALIRLIDRARKGNDARALDEVLRLYTPIWLFRLQQAGLQEADAQDVLGELYVVVLKTIRDLDHPRAFCAYYNRRLSWLVGEHRRTVGRLPSSLCTLTSNDGDGTTDGDKAAFLIDHRAVDPSAAAFKREEERLVREALERLARINADQAEAVRAHYLEERGIDEIAKAQRVPAPTVKTRLFNARTRMRQILAA